MHFLRIFAFLRLMYLAENKLVASTPSRPFGTPLYNRGFAFSGGYKYGFNGKEKDDEVKGNGNSQDYGKRIYDNRLGRFLSVDHLVKEYPMLASYQFASNSPVAGIDIEGLEFYYSADGALIGKIGDNTSVKLVYEKDVKAVKSFITEANMPAATAYPTQAANNLSTDVGMSNDELNLRATLGIIQSGEGGDGENRYKKLYGGGILKDLKKHPGLYTWKTTVDKKTGKVMEHKSSMAGAYQIKGTTYAEVSKTTDFSEENQDKAAVAILEQKGVLDDAKKGNIQTVINKLKASTWTSLQKIKNADDALKSEISKELNDNSKVKTEKGKLTK